MFEAKTDLKTAIFFADGCEEIEGLTVVDLLGSLTATDQTNTSK